MYRYLREYIPWLLTTALSIVLILSNNSPQVELLRGKLSDALSIVTYPVSGVQKIAHLWAENRRLRQELVTLRLERSHYQTGNEENRNLRRMLHLSERSKLRLMAAEVIGLSPDINISGLLINCGEKEGIKLNQAAITPEGAVGRVYRSGRSSALVQLITDKNIGIAGRLSRNRENGIVHASSHNKLTLEGIPASAVVEVGDSVVTSGLDDIFPEGIMIGAVSYIAVSDDGWLLHIVIEPAVKFNSIEELFVVMREESAR